MSLSQKSIQRSMCIAVVVMGLGISLRAGAQAASPAPGPSQAAEQRQRSDTIPELPDSPGATLAHDNNSRDAMLPLLAAINSQEPQSSGAYQSAPPQEQQATTAPQKPVGTAAAGPPNASGIAASQPAGVAIAPAKQHRVRTLVLRTSAIIGAGVAIGTVVALTAATPGKPPGAH